jgi:hypothetical protein
VGHEITRGESGTVPHSIAPSHGTESAVAGQWSSRKMISHFSNIS